MSSPAAYLLGMFLLLSGCASQSENPSTALKADPVTKPADFSGSWEVDYELTENPNEKLRWLYEVVNSQIEQQQRRQYRKNDPGPSGASIKAINDLQGIIKLGALAESMTRSNVLTIEQSYDYIVVQRDGDYSLTCDFLGAAQADKRGAGNRAGRLGVEYCDFDSSGQLVFAVLLPGGVMVQNRMILSESGKRLSVATTVSSSRLPQSFTLNRVYMPFEPGRGMYNCEYSLEKKKTCWLGEEK